MARDGQVISYEIINDEEFEAALDESIRRVSDLRVPLSLIAKDFYKSQEAIFKLQSEGAYPDLQERTKDEKFDKVGFIYPILLRTGRLKKSVTLPLSNEGFNLITKKSLTIGTTVPYAAPHQDGAPSINLPQRKVLFIGPEGRVLEVGRQIGRLQRWLTILRTHLDNVANLEAG